MRYIDTDIFKMNTLVKESSVTLEGQQQSPELRFPKKKPKSGASTLKNSAPKLTQEALGGDSPAGTGRYSGDKPYANKLALDQQQDMMIMRDQMQQLQKSARSQFSSNKSTKSRKAPAGTQDLVVDYMELN